MPKKLFLPLLLPLCVITCKIFAETFSIPFDTIESELQERQKKELSLSSLCLNFVPQNGARDRYGRKVLFSQETNTFILDDQAQHDFTKYDENSNQVTEPTPLEDREISKEDLEIKLIELQEKYETLNTWSQKNQQESHQKIIELEQLLHQDLETKKEALERANSALSASGNNQREAAAKLLRLETLMEGAQRTKEEELQRLHSEVTSLEKLLHSEASLIQCLNNKQELLKKELEYKAQEQKISSAQLCLLEQKVDTNRSYLEGCYQSSLPPCSPWDHCCCGWTTTLDFLYWRADLSSNDYAFYQDSIPPLVLNSPPGLLGELYYQKFEWRPGFRIELGHRLSADLWNFRANYTYYYTASRSPTLYANASYDPTVIPIVNTSFQSGIEIASQLENNNNFHYNVLDLLLSKDLALSKKVWLHFSGGVTGASIRQIMHVKILDIIFDTAQHRWFWSYKAGGVKAGLDSRWTLFKEFNLLVGAYAASLYGSYKNSYYTHINIVPQGGPSDQELNNMHFSKNRTFFTTQIFGGINWRQPFCRTNLEFSLKYELNSWFNLNERYFPSFNNPANDDKHTSRDVGNVSVQGLTASCNFSF